MQRALKDITKLFLSSPSREFDAPTIQAAAYASKDTVAKALRSLVASGTISYRYEPTAKTAKRIYKLNA